MARPCLRALSVALFFTSILLFAASASAQDQIKPRVLVIFDTSGSMLWPICFDSYGAIEGDNSAECEGDDIPCSGTGSCNTTGCGDGVGNDSRLYKVKAGVRTVVSGFGEVEFALARFAQNRRDFECRYGRIDGWWHTEAGAWDGRYCDVSIGTGGNQADLLVPFGANNNASILHWMNNRSDYNGSATVVGASGSTGNDTCTGANQLCADCDDGCDLELRGDGGTPLAGSLYDMRVNFLMGGDDVVGDDSLSACRPYKVVLVTDGQESCMELSDAQAQAAALFSTADGKSIPVHVIGFGDDSLTTNLNAIAASGGTGQAVIVDNEVALAIAMANIIAESLQSETCDGLDNDCDGLCDETFPEVAKLAAAPNNCSNAKAADTCTSGVGICERTGSYVCNSTGDGVECDATPGPPNAGGEICDNGLDDNCDGRVDEGCTPCIVQPEICDGKDNNCNGEVDEGYVSIKCGSNIGECRQGDTECTAQGEVVCNGGTPPADEVCDGLDNNCDTIVDAFAEPCYLDASDTPYTHGCDTTTGACVGICQIGSRFCGNNSWTTCTAVGPATEICNGVDDDCDGTIDNGVDHECFNFADCSTYRTCAPCPQTPTEVCDGKDNDCDGNTDDVFPEKDKPCGSASGECLAGTFVCEGGQLRCSGSGTGSPEVCDGKDNDCDGAIDEDALGVGEPCGDYDLGECKKGVTECINGGLRCVGSVDPTQEICDGKDNDCDGNADNDAICPAETSCIEGRCVSACGSGEFPCPGGTKCVDGWCIPDACAEANCSETQFCTDGVCHEKCENVTCTEHERCEPTTGLCVDDSCVSQGCPNAGEICVNYECVVDPCPPDKCPADQMCVDGKCVELCINVECPTGEVCVAGECVRNICEGYPCPDNHVCQEQNGAPVCVEDPCRIIRCDQGQVCHGGECIDDPCATVTCPSYLECEVSHSGLANCVAKDSATIPTTTNMLAAGGGGCSCEVGHADAPSSLVWLLGLLTLIWRRRRNRK